MAPGSSNFLFLLLFQYLLINCSSGFAAAHGMSSGESGFSRLRSTLHDTVFPTTPTPTTVINVPGAGGPVVPTNPTLTPIVFPPPNNPVALPTPPLTVPVMPGPVTNPVTTFPSPPGIPAITPTVPAITPTVPAITPTVPTINPPATASASPAIPGQSWCVARAGVAEAALQAALDYACGIGGSDCSQIQMGASCYNPSTMQNHASYAFNSYYQRNPVATSCDFGGTAIIVATNPSTGSCVYPTYSQTSAPATTMPTPTPTTQSFSPPTVGAGPVPVPGLGTPPAALNTGNPAVGTPTEFSFPGPPPPGSAATMTSKSARLQPYVGFIILLILVLQRYVLQEQNMIFLGI